MKRKHRELRGWVWMTFFGLIMAAAIFGGGFLNAWLG